MIKSQRQRTVTARKLQQLQSAAESADSTDRTTWLRMASQLQVEIDEYDAITSNDQSSFAINSVDDIGDTLIKARLAKGWTHKQLADELGVAEQMVQKDEAGGYERAGLARIGDVLQALGYDIHGRVEPSSDHSQVLVSQIPTPWRFVGTRWHAGAQSSVVTWSNLKVLQSSPFTIITPDIGHTSGSHFVTQQSHEDAAQLEDPLGTGER